MKHKNNQTQNNTTFNKLYLHETIFTLTIVYFGKIHKKIRRSNNHMILVLESGTRRVSASVAI